MTEQRRLAAIPGRERKILRLAMKVTHVCLLMVLAALLPSAAVDANSPKAERPVWPPAGSTWTVVLKLSGSLGSGSREATFEAL